MYNIYLEMFSFGNKRNIDTVCYVYAMYLAHNRQPV